MDVYLLEEFENDLKTSNLDDDLDIDESFSLFTKTSASTSQHTQELHHDILSTRYDSHAKYTLPYRDDEIWTSFLLSAETIAGTLLCDDNTPAATGATGSSETLVSPSFLSPQSRSHVSAPQSSPNCVIDDVIDSMETILDAIEFRFTLQSDDSGQSLTPIIKSACIPSSTTCDVTTELSLFDEDAYLLIAEHSIESNNVEQTSCITVSNSFTLNLSSGDTSTSITLITPNIIISGNNNELESIPLIDEDDRRRDERRQRRIEAEQRRNKQTIAAGRIVCAYRAMRYRRHIKALHTATQTVSMQVLEEMIHKECLCLAAKIVADVRAETESSFEMSSAALMALEDEMSRELSHNRTKAEADAAAVEEVAAEADNGPAVMHGVEFESTIDDMVEIESVPEIFPPIHLTELWWRRASEVCADLVLEMKEMEEEVCFDPAGIALASTLLENSGASDPTREQAQSAVMAGWGKWRSESPQYPLHVAPEEVAATYSLLEQPVLSREDIEAAERYSRGECADNVSSLDLRVETLTEAAFLCRFTNLMNLNISMNMFSSMQDLLFCRKLKELTARDNVINDIASLQCLPHLVKLHIDINQIQDLSVVTHLKKLKSLNANSNKIICLPIFPASLEKIELFHNFIEKLSFASFASLSRLQTLDLGRNSISEIDKDLFQNCQLLTTLILSQNKMQRFPILRLPLLKTLWLSGNQIATIDFDGMNIFLPSLNKLYLQDNSIISFSHQFLDFFPILNELDISFNQVKSINGFASKSLRSLSIHDNPLLDAQHISDEILKDCPNLSSLNDIVILPKEGRCTYVSSSTVNNQNNAFVHALLTMSYEQHIFRSSIRSRSDGNVCSTLNDNGENTTELLLDQLNRMRDSIIFFKERLISHNSQQSQNLTVLHSKQCLEEIAQPIADNAETIATSISSINAAITIGKLFRGHFLRKKLKSALARVAYEDNDLELLMNDDLDALVKMEELIEVVSSKKTINDESYLVYGDHRRKTKILLERNQILNTLLLEEKDTDDDDIVVTHTFPGEITYKDSRPSSSRTDTTIMTASTEAKSDIVGSLDSIKTSAQLNSYSSIKSVENEWATTDQALLATLLKRNKKMKSFQNAKEIREKEKDSQYRLKKFAKNAYGNSVSPNVSVCKERQRANRQVGRRSISIPAWVIGENMSSG